MHTSFEWDEQKNRENIKKHGVLFEEAQQVFLDPDDHSTEKEVRYYCLGKVRKGILTVRFTYRKDIIRIFGAGYWRRGKARYENEQSK